MDTDRQGNQATISIVRRSARVIGVVIAVFLLSMFIGEAMQSETPPWQIEPTAALGLAPLGVYIVAMFLALKWERVGSLLGAGALSIFIVMLFRGSPADGKSVLPFFLVFWIPILLYWVCWHLEGSSQEPPAPAR
jgi:hypothetical protein